MEEQEIIAAILSGLPVSLQFPSRGEAEKARAFFLKKIRLRNCGMESTITQQQETYTLLFKKKEKRTFAATILKEGNESL